ncbi:hypothetical protein TNCV_4708301 [Trichonephila clavipes]|nr:hypothetical protein TNCV_4708301 [Trichonephila clavipes]
MARRKGRSPVENSDKDIILSERVYEESDESADVINNIPVNPVIYVARDGTEWILYISNVSGRFVHRNVLRQSIGPKAT